MTTALAPSPQKEALLAGTEFLKYTLALTTGALVFGAGLIGNKSIAGTFASTSLVASLILLGVAVAAGALSYSRIPVMLHHSNYDLEDKYLVWPGRVHQVAFLLGMIALGLTLGAAALFAKSGDPTPPPAAPGPAGHGRFVRGLERVGTVGPFVPGSDTALDRIGSAQWLNVTSMLSRLSDTTGHLAYVVIVGSADRTDLLASAARRFGSNAGLARSRAEYIGREISSKLRYAGPILALTRGPATKGAPRATPEDRSVDVFVAWER
jgi:hypothetical protein